MRVMSMRLTEEQIGWLEKMSADLGDIGIRPVVRVLIDHARKHGLARPAKPLA